MWTLFRKISNLLRWKIQIEIGNVYSKASDKLSAKKNWKGNCGKNEWFMIAIDYEINGRRAHIFMKFWIYSDGLHKINKFYSKTGKNWWKDGSCIEICNGARRNTYNTLLRSRYNAITKYLRTPVY